MLMLISPAKTLDYTTPLPTTQHTQARLLEYSQQLIDICHQLSVQDIEQLMKVSEKIASLNAQRFQNWQIDFDLTEARQAIFAFNGDVYTGLDAYHLNNQQLDFAQQHLRILSGLYGLLRPLDLILPYRLEMGTKLENPYGKNLYEFWNHQITDLLNQDLVEQQSKYIINLASDEYFKAVKTKNLNATLIKIDFLDQKHGQYKIISFYAKKARGLMARYIIENKITNLDDLKSFAVDGYYFDTVNSKPNEIIFKRDEVFD